MSTAAGKRLVNRRAATIMVPVLFLAAFLVTAEASGRPEQSGSSGRPIGPSSDVLCGCTEVLKNFA
ncbi:MAG TPA: hypothetical protein VFZ82_11310 [Methylomirabilota bacterium]|nr:hypothetical protein [Methylomirabilota bacterium]